MARADGSPPITYPIFVTKASGGLRSVDTQAFQRFYWRKDDAARDSAQGGGQRSNQLNYVPNRGINNLR
ncbi:MAG TPA: hypothetical protein VNB49_16440 [Candidatus Dormibacteraeota bacterium]|nr:hypothetical protein [Candidatus Dormibacteraeota bacterium]